MTSIYDNDANVGTLTREALRRSGSNLLQIHRFHSKDEAHAKVLLKMFNPVKNAVIIDVGCGVGRLAELMSWERPDLVFILVNKSKAQLDMCSTRFTTVEGVAETLPFPVGVADAIMMTYVLGHVDMAQFASECARLNASQVYIYEIFVVDPDADCRLKRDLGYEERTIEDVVNAFDLAGFNLLRRSQTTRYVPDGIEALMPSDKTLSNTSSGALIFGK